MTKNPEQNQSEFARGRRPVRFRHHFMEDMPMAKVMEAEIQRLALYCEPYEEVFVELLKLQDRELFFDIIAFLEESGFFEDMAAQVGKVSAVFLSFFVGLKAAVNERLDDPKEQDALFCAVDKVVQSEVTRMADPLHRPLFSSILAHLDWQISEINLFVAVRGLSCDLPHAFTVVKKIDPNDPYYEEKCLVAIFGEKLQELNAVERQMLIAVFFCKEAKLRGAAERKIDGKQLQDQSRDLLEQIRTLNLHPFRITASVKGSQSIFFHGEEIELEIPARSNATQYFQGTIRFKLSKSGNYPMELKFCFSRANGELCIDGTFLSSMREFFAEYHEADFYEELKYEILTLLTDSYLNNHIKTRAEVLAESQTAENIEDMEETEEIPLETTEEVAASVETVAPGTLEPSATENRYKKLVGSRLLRDIATRRAQRAIASFGVKLGRSNKHFIYQRALNGRMLTAPFPHGTAKKTNPHTLYGILNSLEIPLEEFLECV